MSEQVGASSTNGRVFIRVAIAIVVTFTAALTSLVVPEAIDGWYATLNRPSFAPPNWLFGPVWTVLYILMGIAAGLVWSQPQSAMRTNALVIYGLQLVPNASWTLIFFGAHAMSGALVVIIILVVMILVTMRAFFLLHRTAGWLLLPYLTWVSFATILNTAYVVLN
jgi:translocator protein